MTAHVALVSPGHLATNPRLVKEAQALCAAGYRVTTICGDFLAWARDADGEFDDAQWTRVRVPFGRDAGLSRWLAQSAIREVGRRMVRVAPNSAWRDVAFHSAVWPLTQAASRVRADLYIAHNLAALPAAGAASNRHGSMLGFDAEDDHVEELADTPANAVERSRRDAVLRAWLPKSAHRTVSAPLLGADLESRYRCSFEVVRNVFDPASTAPEARKSPPRCYWFSQTVGSDRGLQQIVEILARMRSRPHLTVRGNATTWSESLPRRARELGVEVSVFGPAPPSEMTALCADHDIGLALELGDTRSRDRCLSNKAFTYIAAGIPVVLSATTAQRELAAELGAAALLVDLEDAERSAAAFDEFLAPERWHVAVAAALSMRDRLSWRNEQQIFLRSVARTIAAAGRVG